MQIRKNNVKDMLQVVTPLKGSPAYKKGIWAGDYISTIVREVDSNGKKLEPAEIISTKGMTTEEAVKKILGRSGTKVKLIVEREGYLGTCRSYLSCPRQVRQFESLEGRTSERGACPRGSLERLGERRRASVTTSGLSSTPIGSGATAVTLELAREPAVARQLTSTAGGKADAQFTPDSREVFYLEGGRINVVNVESRQARAINVTAELDVDFSKEKMEVFRQAWTYMRDGFYDGKFHGADWNEVRAQFTPIVAGVRTPDELRRVLNLMMGELNASHLGASGPGPAGSQASNNGRLGLMFDREGRLYGCEGSARWCLAGKPFFSRPSC